MAARALSLEMHGCYWCVRDGVLILRTRRSRQGWKHLRWSLEKHGRAQTKGSGFIFGGVLPAREDVVGGAALCQATIQKATCCKHGSCSLRRAH
eukprot:1158524-Pelagomonas_calceolata.AAC.3